MSQTGKTLLILEGLSFGYTLPWGQPFDTPTTAAVTAGVMAATWAIDSLIGYVRRREPPTAKR
jgi:hypothetical protein